MKRTITFLLVLCITLASLACTVKPEPKPDPFIPLQYELTSAMDPANSSIELRIRWIHAELIETLNGSSWVQKDALLNQGGIFKVQLSDQNGDTYRFFEPGSNQTEYFVSVTQASTSQRRAYVISKSTLEALLSELESYSRSLQVLQYPLVLLMSMEMPNTPLTNTTLLESLKRSLSPDLWIRINDITQAESNKRFVLVDEQGDTYSFYEIAPNAQSTVVVVERANHTSMMFRVNRRLLDELADLMSRSADEIIDQYYRNLWVNFVPTQVYFGSSSLYDDSKLVSLPSKVTQLFGTRANTVYAYITEVTEHPDAQSEVLFIAKNEAGDYLTFYAPPNDSLDSSNNFITVSFGKHPLAHAENVYFGIWFGEAIRLLNTLAYSPTEETKPLVLTMAVNDPFVFPAFDMDWEIRKRSYSGNLNSAMVDYLKRLEALAWTQQSFEQMATMTTYGEAHSVIVTASNGTRYILPYNSNYLIVDEDPLTPGALVYATDYESLRTLGDLEASLEFLAQLGSDFVFPDFTVTHYTLRFVDEATDEETFTDFALTSAQSAELTALIKTVTLFKKTYNNVSWEWSFEALFTASANLKIGLRYIFPLESESLYGVIYVADSTNNIYGDYFISIDDYNAILELYRSYLD